MTKTGSVAFVLLGVAALVLKRHYSGPLREVVWEYGGNITASFAVYFLMTLLPFTARSRRLLAASLALLVVEAFEATDDFGIMGNVYDRIDFAANVVGVGLALAVDTLSRRINSRRPDGSESAASRWGG
jgi:hypothetical protein